MSSELGLNTQAVWESIKDLVIKTIICSESHCSSLIKACVQNSYSCHELFGFDVMLDRKMKPWLVEVNISPSLHSNSQLDINIKGQMVRDLLNIAGLRLPQKDTHLTTERQHRQQSVEERQKHSHFLQRTLPECERRNILDKLTSEDVAVLAQTEDEFSRRGMFERVYPSHQSTRYRHFFESEKYYNILLEQWLLKYHRSPARGIDVLQRLLASR
jgi:tubulin polyglutamylase TTLL4